MRIILTLAALALAACAAEPRLSCAEQGHAPGSKGYIACENANGVPIATGPGSPWHLEEEMNDI